MLSKIYYKYNKISKINLSIFCSLVRLVCFYVVIIVSSTHSMEVNGNDGIFEPIKDVVPTILREFHKVSPVCMEFYQAPSDVKSSISLSLVCKKWRKIILKFRHDNNCKLYIPGSKKLITLADYQAIQDSGYKVLDVISESLEPENVSYIECLNNITHLILLPPSDFDLSKLNFEEGWEKNMRPLKQWIRSDVIKNIYLLKNLTILSLESNNIEINDLKSIINLENISKLDLTSNHVNDDLLLSLVSLKKLTFLRALLLDINNSYFIIETLKNAIPGLEIIGLS